MEEGEEVLKKTLELIVKDIKRKSEPASRWIKICVLGFISAAGILLVNKIGIDIKRYFLSMYGNRNNAGYFNYNDKLSGATAVSMVMLALIFGIMIVQDALPFRFFVYSHMIGLLYLTTHYFGEKKKEAVQLIGKNEKVDDQIKIEEKKKELPKIKGGVNT